MVSVLVVDLVVLDPEVWALGVSGPVADLAVFALVVVLVVFVLVVDLVVFVLVVELVVLVPVEELVVLVLLAQLVVGVAVLAEQAFAAAAGPCQWQPQGALHHAP